jgi:hypothetical protein
VAPIFAISIRLPHKRWPFTWIAVVSAASLTAFMRVLLSVFVKRAFMPPYATGLGMKRHNGARFDGAVRLRNPALRILSDWTGCRR